MTTWCSKLENKTTGSCGHTYSTSERIDRAAACIFPW